MPDLYCVRADFGTYTNHFLNGGYAAIGWIGAIDLGGVKSKDDLYPVYKNAHPRDTSNIVIGLLQGLIAPLPGLALILTVVAGPVFVIGLIAHRRRKNYKAEALEPFTEQPLRPPGESLRLKIEQIGEDFDEILLTLMITGLVCLSLILLMPAAHRTFATVTLGLMALVIYIQCGRRLRQAQETLWNHRLGYAGERVVGETLNQLMRDGFHVFHDLPFDDFNIDHVLVGPSGVYCVETKTRRKPAQLRGTAKARVVFDGADLEYPWGKDRHGLIQVRRNAETLSKWLTKATGEATPTKPILVLPGWFVVRKAVGDVNVLNEKEVARSFPLNVREPLSPDRIRRIVHQLSERCRLAAE